MTIDQYISILKALRVAYLLAKDYGTSDEITEIEEAMSSIQRVKLEYSK